MENNFKPQKNKIYPEVHVDNFREFLEHTTNKFSDKVAFSYKILGEMFVCSYFCEQDKGLKAQFAFSPSQRYGRKKDLYGQSGTVGALRKGHRASCPRGDSGVSCAAVGVLFRRYPRGTAHSESHSVAASQGTERCRADTR